MKLGWILILAIAFSASINLKPVFAESKIKMVATTRTFAAIAQEITKDKAEIYAIAAPKRDIHFISPTPKDVLKVKKADVFIHGGMDLEVWRGPLLDAAGRTDLMWPSGPNQIDVSQGIPLLEIPTSLSRSEGDIHAYGNPHYWTDPENGKFIAQNIANGLSRLFPEHAEEFKKNESDFELRLDAKIKEWTLLMKNFQGESIVTYHRSLSYFAERFELKIVGELEPKPGIPPTGKHLSLLEEKMRENKVRVIVEETYFERRTPEKLAKATGASVVTLLHGVGEVKEAPDYIAMIDWNIRQLVQAFQK